MVALLRRNLYQFVPRGRLTIDWSHPLAKGLVIAVTGASPQNLVSGRAFTPRADGGPGATSKWHSNGVGQRGAALTSELAAYTYVGAEGTDFTLPTDSCTVVGGKWRTDSASNPTNNCMIGVPENGPIAERLVAFPPFGNGVDPGTVGFDFGGNTSPNRLNVAGPSVAMSSGDDTYAFRAGRDGSSIWFKGQLWASQPTPITRSAGTSQVIIGNFRATTTFLNETESAHFSHVYLYNRELLPGEIQWISAEPFVFLRSAPSIQRYFVFGTQAPDVVATPVARMRVPRAKPVIKTPPSAPYEIDWGHPLSTGLAMYVPCGEGWGGGRDLVSGWLVPPVAGATYGHGPTGPGLRSTAFNEGAFVTDWNTRWPSYGGGSCLWTGWLTDNGGTSPAFAMIISGVTPVFQIRRSGVDEIEVRPRDSVGSFGIISSGAALSSKYGQPLQIVGTRTIGLNTVGYLGPWQFGVNTANTTASAVVADDLYIGRHRDGNQIGGYSTRLVLWNRALTADEVAWLAVEPYVFLRNAPASRKTFVFPSLLAPDTATPDLVARTSITYAPDVVVSVSSTASPNTVAGTSALFSPDAISTVLAEPTVLAVSSTTFAPTIAAGIPVAVGGRRLPRQSTQQAPEGTFTIDWSHPLSNGLVMHTSFGMGFAGARDLVTGMPITPQGTAPFVVNGPSGRGAASVNDTTSLGATLNTYSTLWPTTGNITILWSGWCYGIHNTTTKPALMATRFNNGAVSPPTMMLRRDIAGAELNLRIGTATPVDVSTTGNLLANRYNRPLHVAGVRSIGQYNAMYLNGVKVIHDTTDLTASTTMPNSIDFGNTRDVAGCINGATARGAMWNRPLTAGEIAWLAVEPYAFLKPTPYRKTFIFTSAPEAIAVAPVIARTSTVLAPTIAVVSTVVALTGVVGGRRLPRKPLPQAPQGAVTIDYSHPLAKGLILAIHNGRDLVGGQRMLTGYAGRVVPSPAGPGWIWDKAAPGVGYVYNPRIVSCANGYTILSTVCASAPPTRTGDMLAAMLSADNATFSSEAGAPNATRIFFHRIRESDLSTPGVYSFIAFYTGGGGFVGWNSPVSLCDSRPHVVAGLASRGRFEQWVDGQMINSAADDFPLVSNPLAPSSQAHYGTVVSPITYMWNRALSRHEMQQISAEPYVLLVTPPSRKTFISTPPPSKIPVRLPRQSTQRAPTGVATVDMSHPLAKDLVLYVTGGVERVLGARIIPTDSTKAYHAASPDGPAFVTTTATPSDGVLPGLYPVERITTQCSVFARAFSTSFTGGSGYYGLLTIRWANGVWAEPYGFSMRRSGAGGGLEFIHPVTGPVYNGTASMGPAIPTSRVVSLAISKDGTAVRSFIDGVMGGTGTLTNGTTLWPASHQQIVLNAASTPAISNETWPGAVSVAGLWSRTLTDDEQAWLHAEPYAFLKTTPYRRTFALSPSAVTIGRNRLPAQKPRQLPTGAVTIDESHPLSVGLTTCVLFGSSHGPYGRDLRHAGLPPTGVGAGGLVLGPDGWRPNDGKGLLFSAAPILDTTSAASFTASFDTIVRFDAATTCGIFAFLGGPTGGTNGGIGVGIGNTSADTDGTQLLGINQWVAWQPTGVNLSPGRWYHIVVQRSSATTNIYLDGRLAAGFAATANASSFNTFNVGVDNYYDVTPRYPANTTIQTARLWNRLLHLAEIQWLAREPYAMLTQKPARSSFFSVSEAEALVLAAAFRGWGIPVRASV